MSQRSIRRRLMGTYTMTLAPQEAARRRGRGSLSLLAVFAIATVVGTVLLALPAASEPGGRFPFLDAFFTTVSALTGTGLTLRDTGSTFSPFGKGVLFVLIEAGGLGYVTLAGVILWRLGERLGLRDQGDLLRPHYHAPTRRQSFAFARTLLQYAFVVQVAGFLALFAAFRFAVDLPLERSAWWALYHAGSAFNLAGFSLAGDGFQAFQDNPSVLVPTALLGIAGSMGAIPVLLALRARSVRRIPLDGRMVLVGTAILLVVTTAGVLAGEWDNPATLGRVEWPERPVLAFFEASMWTGGLSAIDNGALRDHTAFFLAGVMSIGGAAGSAAGGIKVATAALLLFAISAALRGQAEVSPPGRRVSAMTVRYALAFLLCMVALVFTEAIALMAVSDYDFLDVLLEATSATTTAGRTAHITNGFNDAGQVILILGMIAGRFGPLLLILEMTYPRAQSPFSVREEGIRIG